MILRLVQRLAKLSPGLSRAGWAALPAWAQARLEPLIHPIALGKRGGRLRLEVPWDAPRRKIGVVVHAGLWERARAATGGPFPPGFAAPPLRLPEGVPIDEFARREGLLDAVLVSDDPSHGAARRLGMRCVSTRDLDDPSFAGRAFPKVSVVIPAYAGRALLEPCLASLLRNTPWPGLEILVVDNAMAPEDGDWLAALSSREPSILGLRNEVNVGFARAVNRGLARASGEFVVLLNDDTVVGPGWLPRLIAPLEDDPTLGLVCPSTNEIGNSARVPVTYTDLDGMEALATARAWDLAGERSAMDTIALFCAAARRSTLTDVGLLDPRYDVGMFEDDDLSLAVRRIGKTLAVARDAWVHHVGQASFSRLPDDEYLRIWEANRRRFEQKWQVKWTRPI